MGNKYASHQATQSPESLNHGLTFRPLGLFCANLNELTLYKVSSFPIWGNKMRKMQLIKLSNKQCTNWNKRSFFCFGQNKTKQRTDYDSFFAKKENLPSEFFAAFVCLQKNSSLFVHGYEPWIEGIEGMELKKKWFTHYGFLVIGDQLRWRLERFLARCF